MWGQEERRAYLKKSGFDGDKVDGWSDEFVNEMTSALPAF